MTISEAAQANMELMRAGLIRAFWNNEELSPERLRQMCIEHPDRQITWSLNPDPAVAAAYFDGLSDD